MTRVTYTTFKTTLAAEHSDSRNGLEVTLTHVDGGEAF